MRRWIIAAAIAGCWAAADSRAETYPYKFRADYVRVCTASEGLRQYDRAMAVDICHCVVKYLEFKLPYTQMLAEFEKSEKGRANKFDATLTEGGKFCEKLMTEP